MEEIEQFEHELTGVDNQLRTTPGHLDWDKLPESEKFQRLAPSRKQLVDTVKMIAYRARRRWHQSCARSSPVLTTPAACCAICFAQRPT